MLSHWSFAFPRTILAKNEKDQLFLVLFLKGKTLDAAAQVLKISGFSNAINLDGGPSTAFTSSRWWHQGFHEETLLPIFFCVK